MADQTSAHPGRFVRPARADDAQDMAAAALAAWRVGWNEVIPLEVLQSWEPTDLAAQWHQAIVDPPTPAHRVLVATDQGVVRGYAALAPAGDPDLAATRGVAEIVDLVIAPNALGQGHGSRLLTACVDHARGGGAQAVVTWVGLPDEARRSFLQRSGFAPDGAIRDLDLDGSGEVVVRQVRLVVGIDGADRREGREGPADAAGAADGDQDATDGGTA